MVSSFILVFVEIVNTLAAGFFFFLQNDILEIFPTLSKDQSFPSFPDKLCCPDIVVCV